MSWSYGLTTRPHSRGSFPTMSTIGFRSLVPGVTSRTGPVACKPGPVGGEWRVGPYVRVGGIREVLLNLPYDGKEAAAAGLGLRPACSSRPWASAKPGRIATEARPTCLACKVKASAPDRARSQAAIPPSEGGRGVTCPSFGFRIWDRPSTGHRHQPRTVVRNAGRLSSAEDTVPCPAPTSGSGMAVLELPHRRSHFTKGRRDDDPEGPPRGKPHLPRA
jgi:hypothetical protein